jgi:hypothetical protein
MEFPSFVTEHKILRLRSQLPCGPVRYQSGHDRFHRRYQSTIDRLIGVEHDRRRILLRLIGILLKLLGLSGLFPTVNFLSGICQSLFHPRIHPLPFILKFDRAHRRPAPNLLQLHSDSPVDMPGDTRERVARVGNVSDHLGQSLINAVAELIGFIMHRKPSLNDLCHVEPETIFVPLKRGGRRSAVSIDEITD